MGKRYLRGFGFVLLLLISPFAANATYSIVACDAPTGSCGVAVQTNNLAVGASVPYARAGVGAVASQFETNPSHGNRLLELMEQGASPESALRTVLADDHFEGYGAEARQVGVVAINGRAAVHTGQMAKAATWAGSRTGTGYAIQGNGLVNEAVVAAMEDAYLKGSGPLPSRLLAALLAADRAGGQRTGRQSAALLVRTPAGWPVDTDLRVDSSPHPVQDLLALYQMQVARQKLVAAEVEVHRGNFAAALALVAEGVRLAPHWPRTLIQAARLELELQQWKPALRCLAEAFRAGPDWRATEIGAGRYAALGRMPRFQQFVTPRQRADAIARYRRSPPSPDIARSLLEAGEPALARKAIAGVDISAPGAIAPEMVLLKVEIDLAEGHPHAALKRVQEGLRAFPGDASLRLAAMQLSGTR
jgi:uncharacterized Ntn-hydrolase superfamily protein